MYKVFLVDDEYRIKERIMTIETWDHSPFNFCGEASDGEIALSLINEIKPDIVIADIEMPFMNGIELAEILKSTMPWIKVIFLSGHDEFEYAKEAVKLGVSDYLLKPVRLEELKNVLNKVASSIELEKKKNLELVSLQHSLVSVEKLKKDHLFEQLISSHFDSKELLKEFQNNDIHILSKNYIVLDIKIHVMPDHSKLTEIEAIGFPQIKTMLMNQLDKVDNLLWYYKTCERMLVILRGNDEFELKEQAFSIASSIKYAIGNIKHHETTIGIGNIVNRLKQVHMSYLNANKARTYLGDLYFGQIMYIDDIENHMFDKMVTKDQHELSRIGYEDIDDYIKSASDLDNDNSGLMQYYQVINIIFECIDIINNLGGNAKEILPSINEKDMVYMFAKDKQVLRLLLREFIEKMITFKELAGGNKYATIIRTSKDYIHDHFSEAGLSLNDIAKQINLSPNHFSMIFSNETNHTFIEYLTKTRIRHAKALLRDTDQRLSDIAFAVGYNEPQYFSYIFKKNVKVSPSQYRLNLC